MAFIAFWNSTLQPALRLKEEEVPDIVGKLEGFSFAYIKELFLSSMMCWLHREADESMAQLMLSQLEPLREQMQSGVGGRADPPGLPGSVLIVECQPKRLGRDNG